MRPLDCYEADPELLPVAEALRRIDAQTTSIGESERVALRDALDRIRGMGFSIWVADAAGSSVPDVPARELVLAVGSEAHGVSESVREAAAGTVGIPLASGVESLNVGAAGAILLDRLIGSRA